MSVADARGAFAATSTQGDSTMLRHTFAVASVLSLIACSSSSNGSSSGGPSSDDAGSSSGSSGEAGSSSGSSGTSSGGSKTKLTISAPQAKLVMEPYRLEKKGLTVYFYVNEDGQSVGDATATVNGTPATCDAVSGCTALLPDAVPGVAVHIQVTRGSESQQLDIACPADVTITTPAEGSAITPGQKVTVNWNGKIGYSTIGTPASLLIMAYDAASNDTGSPPSSSNSPQWAFLKGTETSATVTAPSTVSGFSITLSVSGDTASDHLTSCELVRRVHLVSQ
jgi:hypothetical protein